MKTYLILEDTHKGVDVEVRWESSGLTDHLETSLSMNLMANLVEDIRKMAKVGAIRLEKEKV